MGRVFGLRSNLLDALQRCDVLFALAVGLVGAGANGAEARARVSQPTRYALVIGNNDTPGRAPLVRAELDAQKLGERLVQDARFDIDRVAIVAGENRATVLAEAARLIELRNREFEQYGTKPTIFALFFTGHGGTDELLTVDGAVTGADLSGIIEAMDAQLTVGFFDSCRSGSMRLRAKDGEILAFNPARVLPEAVSNAEGMIWAASSKSDQQSWEDPSVGGLFTHYFIEAFSRAPREDFGIGLQAMLRYAQDKARRHAERGGVEQTPVVNMSDLILEGPIRFSFPDEPRATLQLAESLEGEFLLEYLPDGLVERFHKRRGAPVEVAVHPGHVTLRAMNGEDSGPTWEVELEAGNSLTLGLDNLDVYRPRPAPGLGDFDIAPKGDRATDIKARRRAFDRDVFIGAGYRFSPHGDGNLGPEHVIGTDVALVSGRWFAAIGVGYGRGREEFSAWGYELDALVLGAEVGIGWLFSAWRADIVVGGEVAANHVRYHSGRTRDAPGLGPSIGVRLWANVLGVAWTAKTSVAARSTEGIGFDDRDRQWTLGPQVSLGARMTAW